MIPKTLVGVKYSKYMATVKMSQKKFLNMFHERADHALKAVQRARKFYDTINCKAGGEYVQLRKVLIEIQSELDPVAHLRYETEGWSGIAGIERTDNSHLIRRSQAQILNSYPSPSNDFEDHIKQRQSTKPFKLSMENIALHSKGKESSETTSSVFLADPLGTEDSTSRVQDDIIGEGITPDQLWRSPYGQMDLEDFTQSSNFGVEVGIHSGMDFGGDFGMDFKSVDYAPHLGDEDVGYQENMGFNGH